MGWRGCDHVLLLGALANVPYPIASMLCAAGLKIGPHNGQSTAMDLFRQIIEFLLNAIVFAAAVISAKSAGTVRSGVLLTADGHPLGRAYAYNGSPSWVFMDMHGKGLSGLYTCVLHLGDGTTVPAGVVTVAAPSLPVAGPTRYCSRSRHSGTRPSRSMTAFGRSRDGGTGSPDRNRSSRACRRRCAC